MNLNNELYQGLIRSRIESPDGETPTYVVVTQEANGYAVWVTGHNEGNDLKKWEKYSRDEAIEYAVQLKWDMRSEIGKSERGQV